jgi:hypothetical protein
MKFVDFFYPYNTVHLGKMIPEKVSFHFEE